jgi:hypothetical protein
VHATRAVHISPAWDDPDAVMAAIRAAGPFWPLACYAANDAEMDALGSQPEQKAFTPPWFRQDFARHGAPLVAGAELILGNEHFLEAARAIGGPDAVVSRFYAGPGGDFHYWPDGPDAPGAVERPPFTNVAVVADNEDTFHGVAPLGSPDARMPTNLDRDSRLVRADGGWDVHDGAGTRLAHFPDREVRVTTSWKADVFPSTDAAARADGGEDPLDLATVVDVFLADLCDRGIDVAAPDDPVHDPAWLSVLASTYRDPAPAIP